MDKKALTTDMGTVGRFAAGGLITGGGTAALLNLIHMLRQQRAEQKDLGEEAQTDKDTIVVNLPPKGAAVVAKFASMYKRVETTGNKITKMDKKNNAGGRTSGGQFDNPLKVADAEGKEVPVGDGATKSATGWPTLTLSALAGAGGAGLGVALVDKLYTMRREKLLKDKLEAAQQEYMGALTGKQASAIDELFPVSMDKQADTDHTFGLLNYPLAAAALLTLMGTGGTAYITKKLLDEKLREAQTKGLDIPSVKRIVFRSASTPGAPAPAQLPAGMKQASAEDMLSLKAAFFIIADKLDTHSRVLGTPEVKQAQAAAGLPTHKLFNLSEGDIGTIMDALNKNPALAKIIVRKGMAARPIMKHFQWAADTTPGLALGKNRIQSFLEQFKSPAAPVAKVANITDRTAAMLLSKTLGEGTGDVAKSLLGDGGADTAPANDAGKPKTDLSKVTLSASDPNAEAYLKANKQKVIKILQHMAAEGKI